MDTSWRGCGPGSAGGQTPLLASPLSEQSCCLAWECGPAEQHFPACASGSQRGLGTAERAVAVMLNLKCLDWTFQRGLPMPSLVFQESLRLTVVRGLISLSVCVGDRPGLLPWVGRCLAAPAAFHFALAPARLDSDVLASGTASGCGGTWCFLSW